MSLKQKYYQLQNLLFPMGSMRRKFMQFLYRLPRYINKENCNIFKNDMERNGFIIAFKNMFNKIVTSPRPTNEQKAYESWIRNNEPTLKDLSLQKEYKFEYSPKISILVPMYKTPEKFFKELIECLKNQTYSNWELCLADGSPEKSKSIDKIIKNDSRIKYKLLEKNDGISNNTNEALKMATGDYIGLLDHDDLIARFALFEVVKSINENEKPDFIYSDEDKFSLELSDRYDPHFKPDFSPDTLRSYNYICHFSVFKKELMDLLGGFKKEYDGAQDYDIILRATENAKNIVHIPKILYHWRVHPNSTACNASAKMYAYDAGRKAIQDHINRLGLNGIAEQEELPGIYRVKYDIIGNPKISILIPSKDAKSDLKKCIESIRKSTYNNYEIIIIENNSETDEIFDYYNSLKNDDRIKVVYYPDKGFNFSRINNFGEKFATGEYILLLNNDVEIITKNWLEEMLSFAQREDVGIVGAKLLYPDNTVQHAGVVVGMGGIAGHINKLIRDDDIGYFARAKVINNYSGVTAACFIIKKELYDKVEGLDEDFKVAFNDVDFCMKIRNLNKLIVYTPYAKLYHYESKTRGYEDTPEKQMRFKSEIDRFKLKWEKELEKGDPFFNPNFRLDTAIYQINPNKV